MRKEVVVWQPLFFCPQSLQKKQAAEKPTACFILVGYAIRNRRRPIADASVADGRPISCIGRQSGFL